MASLVTLVTGLTDSSCCCGIREPVTVMVSTSGAAGGFVCARAGRLAAAATALNISARRTALPIWLLLDIGLLLRYGTARIGFPVVQETPPGACAKKASDPQACAGC